MSVLDVNSRQSWLTARVPGARPLDPIGYDESDLPADRDSTLVFYCSNFMCRKAPNAARRAKGMGYRNVYVMSAGISGWVGASLPTESGEKTRHLDFKNAHREIPRRCSGQVWRSQELLLLLDSQLSGRGDFAVQFQSDTYDAKGNLDYTELWPGSTGASYIGQASSNTYNPNGSLATSYDLNNNETAYSYASGNYSDINGCSGETQYPFPTTIANVGTGRSVSVYYDCEGGVN